VGIRASSRNRRWPQSDRGDRYSAALRRELPRRRDNDRLGKVIFFEVPHHAEAHRGSHAHHAELRKVLAIGDHWNRTR